MNGPQRWNGKCKGCGHKVSVLMAEDGWTFDQMDEPAYRLFPWVRCECGKEITMHSVAGRFRADKGCDARCTGAIGFDCECSCGGRNHGADHG